MNLDRFKRCPGWNGTCPTRWLTSPKPFRETRIHVGVSVITLKTKIYSPITVVYFFLQHFLCTSINLNFAFLGPKQPFKETQSIISFQKFEGLTMSRYSSVFKDESKLDINYVPPNLLHRKLQLNLLNQFFRFAVENPGRMTQRALIMGNIGTGKTVLSQHFGLNLVKEAKQRNINLNYVHINCRECKGSLFMILQRTIMKFYPNFPRRGYSAEELSAGAHANS